MKEKLQRLMYGRNGLDSFGKFTFIVSLVLMLLANFEHAILESVLLKEWWSIVIYTYIRMFSRQTYKRACENQAYLAKTAKVRHFFASQKSIMAQRKTHHIYKCPTCKQKIRVLKGKGRIEIRCPKCKTTFIKKS